MSKKPCIKAILFDFMGVLLFPKNNLSTDNIRDSIDKEIGTVTNDQLFKSQTCAKYQMSDQAFNKMLNSIIDKYERFEDLWQLLPKLRKKYKLAIINNGTALTLPLLFNRHKIEKNFDLFVSSAVEGVRKPDPKIFILTSQRLKLSPQNCLFMDDSLENVTAAKKLGMKTIYWQTKKQGLADFKKFLFSKSD